MDLSHEAANAIRDVLEFTAEDYPAKDFVLVLILNADDDARPNGPCLGLLERSKIDDKTVLIYQDAEFEIYSPVPDGLLKQTLTFDDDGFAWG